MAYLDRERNVIVIRVVYDGPPEAGKTTSLRALAGSLGQNLRSPAEEYGRTLYFDWMDYTAGRFEGYQIRCQIVSVPGQAELARRRYKLLREADVVVFVGDTTRARVVESVECLRDCARFIGQSPAPVGVIFQANKRDLPDALPLDELRKLVQAGSTNIGVVESVAADGTGIREAFVFSVRLALDRAREQLHANALSVGRPPIDSSDELLEQLHRMDSQPPAAVPLLQQVLAENEAKSSAPWRDVSVPVAEEERPRSPDPSAPSGSIWPPVEGRMILQEAASTRMTTHRLRGGGWTAGLGHGWRIFSSADTVYADVEAGREMLIRVARMHVACMPLLSVHRCIVLATTGQSTWRLWQIVRAERPLRDKLNDIGRCTTDEAAARILECATFLCDIGSRMQNAPCHLPCTLDTVGCGERGPVYVGLMPMEPRTGPISNVPYGIGWELSLILRNALQDRRRDVLSAIARVPRQNQPPQSSRLLDEVLNQMAAD